MLTLCMSCNCMIMIMILLSLLEVTPADRLRYLNRIMVKMKDSDLSLVQNELKDFNFRYVEKVIPGIFLFELEGKSSRRADQHFMLNLTSCCQGKILRAQQVVESIKPLWHIDQHHGHVKRSVNKTNTDDDGYVQDAGYTSNSESHAFKFHTGNSVETNPEDTTLIALKSQTYYDMGILDAWSRGFTGKHVIIGVIDVGIDVHHKDLSQNVDLKHSYNALTGSHDVTPEHTGYFEHYHIADHGTSCAGLISASANGFCGDGVANGAKVAGLKAFKIRKNSFSIGFSDGNAAKCLSHDNQSIHIYSSSWSTSKNFDKYHFSMASQQALRDGIEQGRGGKGSIFVFPTGGIADGYANSPFTVTVNAVGAYGERRKYSTLCACVLTSAYGESSSNVSILETASTYAFSKCTREFKGTSAATAIVAGVIALALEANNNLTWRDVQHLLVESSANNSLRIKNEFLINGAGKPYHPLLGFGLLNASRMVQLAKTWKTVPEQKCHSQKMVVKGCNTSVEAMKWDCMIEALVRTDTNIDSVEHVVAKVMYDTPNEYWTELVLQSPSGTRSVLIDVGQSDTGQAKRRNIKLMSTHFWGESVPGTWRVLLEYQRRYKYPGPFQLGAAKITICGSKRHHHREQTTPSRDPGRETSRGSNGVSTGVPINPPVYMTDDGRDMPGNDTEQTSDAAVKALLVLLVISIPIAVFALLLWWQWPRSVPLTEGRKNLTLDITNPAQPQSNPQLPRSQLRRRSLSISGMPDTPPEKELFLPKPPIDEEECQH